MRLHRSVSLAALSLCAACSASTEPEFDRETPRAEGGTGGFNLGGSGGEDPNPNLGGAPPGGSGGTSNRCDAGAYDAPGNQSDEDCSGTADDETYGCDAGLAIDDTDASKAAAALGLCRRAANGSWGLVSARYVRADGSAGMNPAGHGLLPAFGGMKPREGKSMLALSSGWARAPGQADYPVFMAGYTALGGNCPTPAGFPLNFTSCPSGEVGEDWAWDPAALEVVLKVPTNAKGLSFDFDFYTYEFPDWICTEFNDYFVTLMSPAPAGAIKNNVSFDVNGDPISVNNALLQVCSKQQAQQPWFDCTRGTGELAGTGYENHAATGWLTTTVPVTPGATVMLRFAIWDNSDANLDSLVLVDHLRWQLGETPNNPVTEPPR